MSSIFLNDVSPAFTIAFDNDTPVKKFYVVKSQLLISNYSNCIAASKNKAENILRYAFSNLFA